MLLGWPTRLALVQLSWGLTSMLSHPLLPTLHFCHSKRLRVPPTSRLAGASVILHVLLSLSRMPFLCLTTWKTPIHPSKPYSDITSSKLSSHSLP